MNGQPKISVCIPVYKTEKYLQQCIDSLMNQTMDTGIEYIFVNDASPDNCGEILKQNQLLYPDKIKIITHPQNYGLGEARNSAIRVAQGVYIGFTDSDDFVAPWMYETLYQNAVQSKSDVSFIQYTSIPNTMKYNKQELEAQRLGNYWKPFIKWPQALLNQNNQDLTDEAVTDILAHPLGGLYCGLWKRSFLESTHVVLPKWRYEDNYYISLVSCYLKKISFIPIICYFYRQNPASTVHARNVTYHLDRILIEKSLLKEVKKRNLLEKYYAGWEYIYIFRYAYNTSVKLLSALDNPPVDIIRQIWKDLDTEFPQWKENQYYKELINNKKKTKFFILKNNPNIMILIAAILKKIRHCKRY